MFKISASEFCTLSMGRRLCTDEFLARVTECVVHSVYKFVTQSVSQFNMAILVEWR